MLDRLNRKQSKERFVNKIPISTTKIDKSLEHTRRDDESNNAKRGVNPDESYSSDTSFTPTVVSGTEDAALTRTSTNRQRQGKLSFKSFFRTMSLKVNSKTRNKDRKTKEELAAEKALAELRNLPRNPLDLELNELHVALNFNEVRKIIDDIFIDENHDAASKAIRISTQNKSFSAMEKPYSLTKIKSLQTEDDYSLPITSFIIETLEENSIHADLSHNDNAITSTDILIEEEEEMEQEEEEEMLNYDDLDVISDKIDEVGAESSISTSNDRGIIANATANGPIIVGDSTESVDTSNIENRKLVVVNSTPDDHDYYATNDMNDNFITPNPSNESVETLAGVYKDFEVTNATEANTEAGETTDINAETSNAIDAVADTENKVTAEDDATDTVNTGESMADTTTSTTDNKNDKEVDKEVENAVDSNVTTNDTIPDKAANIDNESSSDNSIDATTANTTNTNNFNDAEVNTEATNTIVDNVTNDKFNSVDVSTTTPTATTVSGIPTADEMTNNVNTNRISTATVDSFTGKTGENYESFITNAGIDSNDNNADLKTPTNNSATTTTNTQSGVSNKKSNSKTGSSEQNPFQKKLMNYLNSLN